MTGCNDCDFVKLQLYYNFLSVLPLSELQAAKSAGPTSAIKSWLPLFHRAATYYKKYTIILGIYQIFRDALLGQCPSQL